MIYLTTFQSALTTITLTIILLYSVYLIMPDHCHLPTCIYNYSKANFPEINSYIFNSNILNCLHFCDVETSWAIIKSVIYEAMTLFIPKFRVYSKQYPKWFTKELRHQIKCLLTLRRNYKRSPSDHNATHLNQAENSFQINADTAKSNYETNLIKNFVSTSNPAIYRHIKSFTKSVTIPPTVYFDDASASSDFSELIFSTSNFHSVFTQPSSFIDCINTNTLSSEIATLMFSEEEVYSVLTQLDPNKVTGIDTISPRILKHCASSLTRPLCHLFNLSSSTGSIPRQWKVHLIVPVHKSADQASVKNYRPISVLCNISKVLESLVYNRIINCVLNNANLDFYLVTTAITVPE